MASLALAALSGAAQAQQARWQVVVSGNMRVAKVAASGAVSGVAITCDGLRPVIALNLNRAPARSPAQLTLRLGSTTANLAIARNGATNVWYAYVADTRLLDRMGREPAADIAINGTPFGRVSLDGAEAAMRDSLTSCYRMAPSPPVPGAPAIARPATPPPVTSGGDATAAAEPMATAILALAPAPGAKPFTLAMALQRVPALRRGGTYGLALGELDVMVEGGDRPAARLFKVDFSNAPVAPGSTRLKSRLYDPVAALRKQGAMLRTILCTMNDGNRDEWLAVNAPGRAPFYMNVTNWPPKRANENYVLSVSVFYDRPPTAAGLVSGMEEKPRRCPA